MITSIERNWWCHLIVAAVGVGATFMNSVPFGLLAVAYAVLYGAEANAAAILKAGKRESAAPATDGS